MITDNQPYYNYRSYLVDTYGSELYTIPIDLDFGCPNRNIDGTGGCTFCAQSGARAQQTTNSRTIEDQVKDAISFARKRYGAKKFMAYIQAFTGTFAPVSEQRKIYDHILHLFEFEAVHIGTRPDCLEEDTVDFLCELNKRLNVVVELGIQTTKDSTLTRISRGHSWADSKMAVELLHSRGVPVIAHVILGLPGERMDDFIDTADELAKLPLAGLKIHNLHVIRNTALAEEYRNRPFKLLNEHEYLNALIEFIRRTPARIPIIRIQTDTPSEDLIAPHWSLEKGQMIAALVQQMKWRHAWQGELAPDPTPTPYPEKTPEPIETDDGSITFWNDLYKEHYHTSVGAQSEAVEKYINPSKLSALLKTQDVRILDVCFGLGYNSIYAAMEAIGDYRLDITALEIDRQPVNDALAVYDNEHARLILTSLLNTGSFEDHNLSINMVWGDARHTAKALTDDAPFDIIFLDAFSTQRNSELWTVDFFNTLRNLMNPKSILLTYCSSLPVISGLMEAGFQVGRTRDVGRIRGGTIASLSGSAIDIPLNDNTLNEIHTSTRGIPYRDPTGTASNSDILKSRELQLKTWKATNIS